MTTSIELLNGFAVETTGGGSGDPLILIHGAVTFQGCRPLLTQSLLSGTRRVIHYFRRGYGQSPPLPDGFTVADHAADFCTLLHRLGITRAHVLAHSIGAPIAMQAALDDPELVRSLVLVEPTWVSRPALLGEFSERMSPIVQSYLAGEPRAATHQMLRMIDGDSFSTTLDRAFGPGWFDYAVDAFDIYIRTELPGVVAWTLDEERASRLTQPVLVITGGDSPDVFKDIARDTIARFPSTRGVSVDGGAHNLIAARPAAVAAVIHDFLVEFDHSR